MKSKFVVVDGITGSGKSTIIQAFRGWADNSGRRVFDLQTWYDAHPEPPTIENVKDFDLLMTFEPTKAWIGSAIRYEMSRDDDPYTALALAQAFSLDRLVQYKRLIIPALKAGKSIIQDRSVTSSIAIQPIMEGGPSLKDLIALPGNALALLHPPTDLILTNLDAKIATERLAKRAEFSKGVFEREKLLRSVHDRYYSNWFEELFISRGSTIHKIDTGSSIEELQQNAIKLITSIFTT